MEEKKMANGKNQEQCKAIADDLEKVASGDYFMYDGDLYPIDTDDFSEVKGCHYDEEDDIYIMADGEQLFADDVCPVDVLEWLGDVDDVEYTIGSSKEYRGVRLMIACGGPNIYINTNSGDVELYWWNESACYPMSSDVVNMINSVYEEIYNC